MKTDFRDLHTADAKSFGQRVRTLLKGAIPLGKLVRRQSDQVRKRLWDKCNLLAREPNILGNFVKELKLLGVAGEDRIAKLIFLVIVSRLLDRPVSLLLEGESSVGKSFVLQMVLRFFPKSAYYMLTAMSERALIYDDEPLKYRVLVLVEAAGLIGDIPTYIVRSLLSEGLVKYATVEKTDAGMKTRIIVREGPTGLIVATASLNIDTELRTRLVVVAMTDSAAQTARILVTQGRGKLTVNTDRRRRINPIWHELQRWLQASDNRVIIPFAEALAKLVNETAVTMRRAFPAILSLIEANAILHQASRQRMGDGVIVASPEDYRVVHELVAHLISQEVEATVPERMRHIVLAVNNLSEGKTTITFARVAKEAKVHKSTASRWAKKAVQRGYLKNEARPGQPADLRIGEPMPEDIPVIPLPKELERAIEDTGLQESTEVTAEEGDGCAVAGKPEELHSPPVESGDSNPATTTDAPDKPRLNLEEILEVIERDRERTRGSHRRRDKRHEN